MHLPSAVVERFAQVSNVAFGAVAVRRKTRARAAILTRTSHSYERNERAPIHCTRHSLLLRHLAYIAHDFDDEIPQSAVHLFPVTVPKPHLTGRPGRYQGLRHVQATNVAPNFTKRSESHFANEKKFAQTFGTRVGGISTAVPAGRGDSRNGRRDQTRVVFRAVCNGLHLILIVRVHCVAVIAVLRHKDAVARGEAALAIGQRVASRTPSPRLGVVGFAGFGPSHDRVS